MEWSWKSHEFSILVKPGSGPFTGPPLIAKWIRGLDVSDSAPSELVIGAGGEVLDRTDPAYVPGEGTLTVLSRSYREFAKLVTGQGAVRMGTLDFTLIIKSTAGFIAVPSVDTVEFGITNASDAKAQGETAPNETPLTLIITKILRDGVQL